MLQDGICIKASLSSDSFHESHLISESQNPQSHLRTIEYEFTVKWYSWSSPHNSSLFFSFWNVFKHYFLEIISWKFHKYTNILKDTQFQFRMEKSEMSIYWDSQPSLYYFFISVFVYAVFFPFFFNRLCWCNSLPGAWLVTSSIKR